MKTNNKWFSPVEDFEYMDVYFCYLDLMGYKAIIEKHGPKAPEWIYNRIREAVFGHEDLYEDIEMKLLSDSILIWIPTNSLTNFLNLLNAVERVCRSFSFQCAAKCGTAGGPGPGEIDSGNFARG